MRGEQVVSTYRGFVLLITDRDVTVLDRRGRVRLGRVASMKAARLFVKGYERAERAEVSNQASERPWPLTFSGSAAHGRKKFAGDLEPGRAGFEVSGFSVDVEEAK